MKLNQYHLYAALFVGGLAILVISDYSRYGSLNLLSNFLQSVGFTVVYILVMGKDLKRNSKKNPNS